MEDKRSVEDALADFTVEAIDEATDTLRNGDTGTKLALIKLVLSGAMKAKSEDTEGEIERLKAEARGLISKTLGEDFG